MAAGVTRHQVAREIEYAFGADHGTDEDRAKSLFAADRVLALLGGATRPTIRINDANVGVQRKGGGEPVSEPYCEYSIGMPGRFFNDPRVEEIIYRAQRDIEALEPDRDWDALVVGTKRPGEAS